MEQKRLDLYTFSEHQLILLNTCINAWRGSTFWALMYMQSRLFHAENVDSIYRELQAQPAQYDQIMERYYGIQLITGTAAAGSPLYRYYAAYLDALDARQRSQAERIRCQWLDLNRLTAARLSALNPHWDASLWRPGSAGQLPRHQRVLPAAGPARLRDGRVHECGDHPAVSYLLVHGPPAL